MTVVLQKQSTSLHGVVPRGHETVSMCAIMYEHAHDVFFFFLNYFCCSYVRFLKFVIVKYESFVHRPPPSLPRRRPLTHSFSASCSGPLTQPPPLLSLFFIMLSPFPCHLFVSIITLGTILTLFLVLSLFFLLLTQQQQQQQQQDAAGGPGPLPWKWPDPIVPQDKAANKRFNMRFVEKSRSCHRCHYTTDRMQERYDVEHGDCCPPHRYHAREVYP